LLDSKEIENLRREAPIDTILMMNVLEHIEDDSQALAHLRTLLPPGGKLVIVVPAHQLLYSKMDANIDHFRRYAKKGLVELLEKNGYAIRQAKYANWLGAVGWFVNGRIFRRKLIPSRQLRLFDFLIFLLRIEKYVPPPFGLSLFVVAEKEETADR